MKNKPLQQGFTLIELAIVVVVIMILALFVFPAYSNYVKQTKVIEGLALASTAKVAVAHHATTNNVPLASIWSPPKATDAVTNIDIHLTDTTGISSLSHGDPTSLPARQPGEIVIVFSPKIAPVNHNALILSPRRSDPAQQSANGHELPLDLSHHSPLLTITWECNSANPPALNRGTRGNLDKKLAPADCRA